MKEKHPSFIGFFQAVGVVAYTALVALFVTFMDHFAEKPQFLGIILFLTLFVFSAAVSALIVFGYPVHLVLKKNVQTALTVLAYTLIFLFSIVLLISLLVATLF